MSRPAVTAPRRDQGVGIAGYEYGNTRLRARRGELLSRDDLRELLATGSPERLLGALRSTAYGVDVERALVHSHVLQRVDAAVREHLVRQLGDVRRFYTGRALEGVDLLLSHWDLENLLAILRARMLPGVPVDPAPLLVPAGVLDPAALAELGQQPSLRTVVDTMVAWDLPSRETARGLLPAWRRYEETGEPVVLEEVLTKGWAATVAGRLGRWRGTDLDVALRSEIDRVNLLAALRRRADAAGPAPEGESPHLPGGALAPARLDEVTQASTADEVAAIVTRYIPKWSPALEAWTRDSDLSALDGRLQALLTRWAIGRFTHGDPLGIAIPIAFVRAKESEARNIRLVGRAIVNGLQWHDVEEDVVP